jgi:hypothetical protein
MDSDRWIDPVLIKPLGMVVVVVAIYADTERWLVVLNAVLDALSMLRIRSDLVVGTN